MSVFPVQDTDTLDTVVSDADVFVLCIKLTHQAHGDLLFLLIQHLFKNTGGYGWFEVKTVTASFHLG